LIGPRLEANVSDRLVSALVLLHLNLGELPPRFLLDLPDLLLVQLPVRVNDDVEGGLAGAALAVTRSPERVPERTALLMPSL
jgi:hypothetical protein